MNGQHKINRRLLINHLELKAYAEWRIYATLEETGAYRLIAVRDDGTTISDLCVEYLGRLKSFRANTMEASVEDMEANIEKARHNLIDFIEFCDH